MHDPTLPSLTGCYVYGDLGTPGLRIVHLGQPSASASVALGPQIASLSSFGLDASGHLYAADIANGDVYRIQSDGNAATDPRCAPPSPPLTPPRRRRPHQQHAPVNTSAPAIHGSPITGATLACTPGTWRGATSFAYEWLRDTAPRAAGRPTCRAPRTSATCSRVASPRAMLRAARAPSARRSASGAHRPSCRR